MQVSAVSTPSALNIPHIPGLPDIPGALSPLSSLSIPGLPDIVTDSGRHGPAQGNSVTISGISVSSRS